jgi:hypothetical protein
MFPTFRVVRRPNSLDSPCSAIDYSAALILCAKTTVKQKFGIVFKVVLLTTLQPAGFWVEALGPPLMVDARAAGEHNRTRMKPLAGAQTRSPRKRAGTPKMCSASSLLKDKISITMLGRG